ncbi:hypothetical protein D6861_008670 [Macrococcoides caseolyticum]|nr:hypothetical protein [Macrococcus caseolyticus]RKO13997.1 hypothetical protein D6861_08750 [Macrococcus caseolyticus]
MRKIKSLTKIFILNAMDFKAMFIMTLILPVIFMYWNNYNLIGKEISDSRFYTMFFGYSAFISVMHVVSGNNIGLLYYRENGFFKMFKYITGSKYTVILSNFIAQYFTLLISLLIFSVLCSISFKIDTMLVCIIISLVNFIFIVIPTSVFFLWIPLLNARPENISPFVTIFIIILTALANMNINSYLLLLNPIYLYSVFSSIILNIIKNEQIDNSMLIMCIVTIFIYLVIGLFCSKKIDINSKSNRV